MRAQASCEAQVTLLRDSSHIWQVMGQAISFFQCDLSTVLNSGAKTYGSFSLLLINLKS